jgi:hypothetical protein
VENYFLEVGATTTNSCYGPFGLKGMTGANEVIGANYGVTTTFFKPLMIV